MSAYFPTAVVFAPILLWLTSCSSPLDPVVSPEGKSWVCVWSDDCEGPSNASPNAEKWGYEEGFIRNQELQYYTRRLENSRYNGQGQLVIETRKEIHEGALYTSASLTTRGKYSFRYGKIVIHAKLPCGKGIWPAFWMLGDDGLWPSNGEIDIMEMCGGGIGFDNVIHLAVHYSPWYWWHEISMTKYELPAGIFADAYHSFELEWNSRQLTWRIDGETRKVLDISSEDKSEFRQGHYIKINTAIGGSWPNNMNKRPDDSTPLPQTMLIESVRVYQLQ